MNCPHCPRAGSDCRGIQIARLCELVDSESPAYNPAYRAVLVPADGEAAFPSADEQPGYVPLAESLRLTALSRQCLFRSKPRCHCEGAAACGLRGGADVSAHTCWDCARLYGA